MPAMDSRIWRRMGYLPAGDAARAIGMRIQSLHHQMNKGRIYYQVQGRYRFVALDSIIRWVKANWSDPKISARHVQALREAIKLRNDAGTKRET